MLAKGKTFREEKKGKKREGERQIMEIGCSIYRGQEGSVILHELESRNEDAAKCAVKDLRTRGADGRTCQSEAEILRARNACACVNLDRCGSSEEKTPPPCSVLAFHKVENA